MGASCGGGETEVNELDFIAALRDIARHPAARGLADDAAVLTIGRQKIVFTHDMLVEGVHFLPDTNPADVAWKLVAVNLSDLAAKGAKPLGVLLGFGGRNDSEWERQFLAGLKDAIAEWGVPLIGGDTVGMPQGSARCFGMTAIGEARGPIVQSRSDAQIGDYLYVTGSIGDSWAGLQLEKGMMNGSRASDYPALSDAYRRPRPLVQEGRALSGLVRAMMDISDGLLVDADRLAKASGIGIAIDLEEIPLSEPYQQLVGQERDAVLNAATGGDDYQLLFAAGCEIVLPVPATQIGRCQAGEGITLYWHGEPVAIPEKLGYLH